jgi:hypothetical protein
MAVGPDASKAAPSFHAPFNKVSNFRDPGRVNINTIPGTLDPTNFNSPVWTAILNGGPGPEWKDIVASRRGDSAAGSNVTASIAGSTYFPRPFRGAGGAMFSLPGATPSPLEVDATLLRRYPGSPNEPLFRFPSGMVRSYNQPDRNPFFRYQPLTRLSNLLTTRSNVYAIWVTIGYFEVRAGAPTDARPDGYELLQELGSDTGEITRHRAFYIYDRSVPVGFEPGKDHNFEDGLLVRRFIE